MTENSQAAWFGAGLGVLLTAFGGYILYEKVILAVLLGHAHERAGVTARSDEPFSFWLGVGTFGACGLMVFIAGLVLVVSSINVIFKTKED